MNIHWCINMRCRRGCVQNGLETKVDWYLREAKGHCIAFPVLDFELEVDRNKSSKSERGVFVIVYKQQTHMLLHVLHLDRDTIVETGKATWQ